MYSLNVPIPGEVARLAADLHPALHGFETVRDVHTLVLKRFGTDSHEDLGRLEQQVRTALAGAPTFEARVSGVDTFDDPPRGAGPVVYLAIESPGLVGVHEQLLETFDPVDGVEGDDYVPHVTLARDVDEFAPASAPVERVLDRDVPAVTWTVTRLQLWDATYDEVVGRVPLPA